MLDRFLMNMVAGVVYVSPIHKPLFLLFIAILFSKSFIIQSILDTDLFKMQLQSTANKIDRLKERLTDKGYKLVGNERLKLTVNAKEYGFSGFELAKIFCRVLNSLEGFFKGSGNS